MSDFHIKRGERCGMHVYKVFHGDTYHGEHLSEQGAITYCKTKARKLRVSVIQLYK